MGLIISHRLPAPFPVADLVAVLHNLTVNSGFAANAQSAGREWVRSARREARAWSLGGDEVCVWQLRQQGWNTKV